MILKKQTLVVAMMSSLLVTGCATNDGDRTRMEGAGLGALIGAVVGGIAGDEKGAVLGALIGGGVGFIVGNEIAKRKQQYATTEEFLDAEVAHVQAINDSTVSYNKKSAHRNCTAGSRSNAFAQPVHGRSGQAD